MRTPSRRMPAAPGRKAKWWAWPFLGAVVAGIAYWFYRQPYLVGVLFAGLGVFVWIQMLWEARLRRHLALSRRDESICNFARSFERGTDTWIVRAAYEEVCRFIAVDRRPIPVHRDDRCEQDLRVDPEDLDDLARDIAFRARRSMAGCDQNPLYGKVKTVGDIVAFLGHRPRIAEPDASPNGGPVGPSGNSSVGSGPPSVS